MYSNYFFKISEGKITPIPSVELNMPQEKTIITYRNFSNIVPDGNISIPDSLKKVEDVYEFILELGSNFAINKSSIDFYYNKLKGDSKNRFIELFDVVEICSPSNTISPQT